MTTRDPERVTVVTYKNKKGDHRVAVQTAYSLGLKVAVGDPDAIAKVLEAITTRIEREESKPSDV